MDKFDVAIRKVSMVVFISNIFFDIHPVVRGKLSFAAVRKYFYSVLLLQFKIQSVVNFTPDTGVWNQEKKPLWLGMGKKVQ